MDIHMQIGIYCWLNNLFWQRIRTLLIWTAIHLQTSKVQQLITNISSMRKALIKLVTLIMEVEITTKQYQLIKQQNTFLCNVKIKPRYIFHSNNNYDQLKTSFLYIHSPTVILPTYSISRLWANSSFDIIYNTYCKITK